MYWPYLIDFKLIQGSPLARMDGEKLKVYGKWGLLTHLLHNDAGVWGRIWQRDAAVLITFRQDKVDPHC